MKQIFFWLLNRYSNTEEQRIEIHKVLHEKVTKTYYEQTPYGNVYNAHIEFCLSQPLIKKLTHINDTGALDMIERGIDTDDFIDEQISIEGHSIQDLIDYVQGELDNPTGGKRKMRKMRKSRKITRKRRTRKHRRRRTRRYH